MIAHPSIAFFAAFAVAALGTWGLSGPARRIGAVSRVQADRWHTTGDVPRLAGPALLLAVAPWMPLSHLAVLAATCALGAVDDISPLSAATKAIGLLVIGVAAMWITGSWWVGPALWLAANAFNLLDHADGVAAATAVAAFLGLGGESGLAAAGACAGFLLFNLPPARAFMGDSGSLTLGAMVILIAERAAGPVEAVAWCAIPLADAVFVTLRRLSRGDRPWEGGTDHSAHVLTRRGVPPALLPPAYFAAALLIGTGLTALRP